ncbi:MAG TPA: hypothetical protein VFR68_10890 [Candidatus Dormibacteraeota bacterium]|nr:hypothetical protein [Candidatus Dormibacteraeota bacterium]
MTAAPRINAVATRNVKVSPTWIRGPESADPTGWPAQFSPIDTAKARPYQAGSVLRCRIENMLTSSGPSASPATSIPRPTIQALLATARMATPSAVARVQMPMTSRSRPSLSKRPAIKADGTEANPRTAQTSPTRAASPWMRSNTMTGRATTTMPQPRFRNETTRTMPRSAALSTSTYRTPASASARSAERSRVSRCSGNRAIRMAARTYRAAVASKAAREPDHAVSAPASAGPTPVVAA